ncbi:hypothetical protein [Microbacterium phyllosphaerae]|uniref:hypothetical protein n=1 Tax=Microbacterium phyllosphaerae TaxID=124798 RepID=UPI0021683573|nr:hypothetical protein [Microbacterium phyllosphaerae]MCS3442156.1 hypothetical protein [Microbacterium phyllosphaerae]
MAEATESVEVTRVSIPFDSAQSANDALRTTQIDGMPVVAYRFENPEIVGELSASENTSVEGFLQAFNESYGTQPQFVAAIVEMPADEAKSSYAARSNEVISSNGPAFTAEPVDQGRIDALLEQRRFSAAAHRDGATVKRLHPEAETWFPEYADIIVEREDPLRVLFDQYYTWNGSDSKTSNQSADDGFEMEVNINTSNPAYQAGFRGGPACPPGYKDQPFAKNYDFEWWAALVNTGSGLTGMAADVNAYADYNDLFDDCNRSSMAIGFRTPQAIPSYPNGQQEVAVQIMAFRGAETTGRISSGLVQPVNATSCVLQPWLSLTDCMGISDTASESRMTVSEKSSVGWVGPSKCWSADEYGFNGAQSYC